MTFVHKRTSAVAASWSQIRRWWPAGAGSVQARPSRHDVAVLHTALAVAAGLVALAFALSTLERWLDGRRRHELAWSIALAFFSLAAFSLAAGAALGWSPTAFRLFYLFGAIVNVPVLALGTVYLLLGEERGDRAAVAVGLLCAFAAGVVLAAPMRALPTDRLAQGEDVFGALPRIFAAVGSGVGAIVIFAGALWSAARYRRGRMLWANALIAAGTGVLSASGVLNSVFDEMDAFAVTLVVGISVIFAGFLVAGSSSTTQSPVLGVGRDRSATPTPEARGATASRPSREATRART